MLDTIIIIGSIASAVMSFIAFVALLVKPVRERILGEKAEKEASREAMKCLIRSHIVSIYYKHLRQCEIHQYEYENLTLLYEQYKALGGNSFVDKIYGDVVEDWNIIKD